MRNREYDAGCFHDAKEFLALARLRLSDLMNSSDATRWTLKRALMVSSMIERIQKLQSKCELLARDCRDGRFFK